MDTHFAESDAVYKWHIKRDPDYARNLAHTGIFKESTVVSKQNWLNFFQLFTENI